MTSRPPAALVTAAAASESSSEPPAGAGPGPRRAARLSVSDSDSESVPASVPGPPAGPAAPASYVFRLVTASVTVRPPGPVLLLFESAKSVRLRVRRCFNSEKMLAVTVCRSGCSPDCSLLAGAL